MALVNIFPASAPSISGYEFDAVLENTLEATAELTGYTIELGARASDHRILNPIKWMLTVVVSNNPLQPQLTDFIGALTNNQGGLISQVAGLSAGFLAGSDVTRSSAALDFLLTTWATGEPFAIDAVDVQLENMVIKSIKRKADISTEGGLIAEVELQELPTLETVLAINAPTLGKLNEGDPAYTQAVAQVNRGEIVAVDTDVAFANLVDEVNS